MLNYFDNFGPQNFLCDPSSVRDVVPHFDANLLGIDIFELESERFTGPKHLALLVKQEERVRRWEIKKRLRDFDGHLQELGEMWRAKKQALREARRLSRDDRYDFSHDQLAIALRSLNEKGSM